jgi:outer membrane protein OmpU
MKTEGKIMKKILFATTALVATASVAAADVTFSGYGRFGVKYSGSVAGKAAVAGTALTSTQVTALTGASDTAIGNAGSANDTLAEQIDLLNAAINGTPAVVATQAAITIVADDDDATTDSDQAAGSVVAQTAAVKGLAEKVADAQAAIDLSIQNTGASTTNLDTALKTASDNLAAVEKTLAGIVGTEAVAAIASDTLITSRLRMNIDASTESDSGVTFGVRVRVQQDEGNTNAFNSARFYAKSGGLELGVGNIYGVIDNMAGLYSGSVGLTGLGWGNVVTGFATHDYADKGNGSAASQESIEVVYSMGDYTVHVSHNGVDTEIAGSATFSGVTVGLGTSTTDVATQAEQLATLGGSIGGVNLGLAYGKLVDGTTHTTLSMGMSVGAATSMSAYISDDEANTDKNYGVGLVHDLGAGTSLRGGVVSIDGDTRADFGVLFNF